MNKMKTKLLLGLTMAGLLTGSVAFAAPITPHYDTFGLLAGATFGGIGISNAAVAITTISNGGNTITLGLTATPRYPNPPIGLPLPNDGMGTFSATPGPADATHLGYGTWNYDFYANVTGGNVSSYNFTLVYMNNTTGMSSSFSLTPILLGTGTDENSFNLGFAFSTLAIAFNPNDIAQYGFQLEVYDATSGSRLGYSAIDVNVGNPSSVPDSGTTVAMLGLGVIGMAGFGLRKRLAKA